MSAALAIVGLTAFAVQFSMLVALRFSGVKKDPVIVAFAGLVAELAFVWLAVEVLV